MDAEEVVDRGLGVILHFPTLLYVDVVHQVKRPKIIINLLEFRVTAPEPGNILIELAIHLHRLGREHRLVLGKNFEGIHNGLSRIVVHGP